MFLTTVRRGGCLLEKIIRNNIENTGVVLGKFIKKGCQSLFIIYAKNSVVVLLLIFSRISSEFHRYPPLSTKICLQSANPLRDPFAKYLYRLIPNFILFSSHYKLSAMKKSWSTM